MTTIAEALSRFQSSEEARAPQDAEATDLVLQNLVHFLEGYGYQYLEDHVEERLEEAVEDAIGDGLVITSADDIIDIRPYLEGDDDVDFIEGNAPDIIPSALEEFLYDWQIRKFLGDEDDARDAARVTERLMTWLASEGLADADAAREAAAIARSAADEVPRALRLSYILDAVARASSRPAAGEGDDEIVDDFLAIERVAPGRLWFEEGVGPIKVPEEASGLAEVGWWVNVVAAHGPRGWEIVEVGNVYPRNAADPDDSDDGADDLEFDQSDLDDPA